MCAALDDPAAVYDQHLIGLANGAQAMSHNHTGTTSAAQVVVDLLLRELPEAHAERLADAVTAAAAGIVQRQAREEGDTLAGSRHELLHGAFVCAGLAENGVIDGCDLVRADAQRARASRGDGPGLREAEAGDESAQFLDLGLDGLEVHYPGHTEALTERVEALRRELAVKVFARLALYNAAIAEESASASQVLNDQAQRTVLCKDPFRSHDERVEKLIASL